MDKSILSTERSNILHTLDEVVKSLREQFEHLERLRQSETDMHMFMVFKEDADAINALRMAATDTYLVFAKKLVPDKGRMN